MRNRSGSEAVTQNDDDLKLCFVHPQTDIRNLIRTHTAGQNNACRQSEIYTHCCYSINSTTRPKQTWDHPSVCDPLSQTRTKMVVVTSGRKMFFSLNKCQLAISCSCASHCLLWLSWYGLKGLGQMKIPMRNGVTVGLVGKLTIASISLSLTTSSWPENNFSYESNTAEVGSNDARGKGGSRCKNVHFWSCSQPGCNAMNWT